MVAYGSSAHDVPVALAPKHPHLAALTHVLAFGHDVHPLPRDRGGARRAEIGDGDTLLADEVRAQGARDIALGLLHAAAQEEPAEAIAVRDVAEPGVDHRGGDEQARTQDREGLGHLPAGRRRADQREHRGSADRSEPEEAGDAEPRQHQHLDRERDHAEAEEEHFLPSREPEQEAGAEEEAQRAQAHESAQAECAALDLQHESEHAERQQERRDQRIGEKADQLLGPVGIDADHLRPRMADGREQRRLVGHLTLRVADPASLAAGEREQGVLPVEAGNLDRLVHHGLRDAGVEAALLGDCPELGAHGRNHLLGGPPALAIHRGGGTQHRAGPHVDGSRRYGDQGPGAECARVHEGVDGDGGPSDGVGDALGGVHPAAGCVDIQIRGGGSGVLRLPKAPRDVRGETVLHRPGDGDAVHRRRLPHGRGAGHENGERQDHQVAHRDIRLGDAEI